MFLVYMLMDCLLCRQLAIRVIRVNLRSYIEWKENGWRPIYVLSDIAGNIKQPVDWAVNWYYYNILWVVVAMFGGMARYLDGYVKGHNKAPSILKLIANILLSGFTGYTAAHIVIHISFDWAIVAASVGGYLGTQIIDWAATVMAEKFGGNWHEKIARDPIAMKKDSNPDDKYRRVSDDLSE